MQVVPPLLVKVLPIELHRGFARFHLALSQGHATENYCTAQLFCIKVSLLLGCWIWEQQVRVRYLRLYPEESVGRYGQKSAGRHSG